MAAPSLTRGQQGLVDNATAALARSHKLSLGAATVGELCQNVGRLEVALRDALQIIRELTEGGA